MRIVLLLIVAFLSAGCAHVMSDSGLKRIDTPEPFSKIIKNPEAFAGKHVLTGGIIAGIQSSGDVIMLEVTQLELFNNGVPDEESPSAGRFLAISGELLDPLIYRPGNLVTIIGEVKGKKIQKLENRDYPYALISIRELRMFRASEPFTTYPNNPYQNQFGDNKLMLRPPGPTSGEPQKIR